MFGPVGEVGCEGIEGGGFYTGAFIGHLGPFGKSTKKYKLTFTTVGGIQSPLLFEGEKETASNERLELYSRPIGIDSTSEGEIEFENTTELIEG